MHNFEKKKGQEKSIERVHRFMRRRIFVSRRKTRERERKVRFVTRRMSRDKAHIRERLAVSDHVMKTSPANLI